MSLSMENLIRQLICGVLALTLTVLSTQTVIRSSGLSNVTEGTTAAVVAG